MNKITIFSFLVSVMLSPNLFAYIGPGAGGGFLLAVFGFIFAIFLFLLGIIYYPLKRFFNKIKNKRNR